MLNIYFVRHAQTEWNAQNKVQGRNDSNLTAKGIADANKLRKRLMNIDWTAIYTSPSKRTLETLEIVSGKSSGVKEDERLVEMDLGDLEGMTMEEIKKKDADQFQYYWKQPSQYQYEKGENFTDVHVRVEQFLNELLQRYETGNILIMTHGVVIKMVQMIAGKRQMDELWQTAHIDGTSVTKLKVENKRFEIAFEGDVTHLNNCTNER